MAFSRRCLNNNRYYSQLGFSGRLQNRQWQQCRRARLIQNVGSHVAATAAIAAKTGTHGEFGNITNTIGSGALDSFIGDTKTNANVHGRIKPGYE